MGLVLVGVVMVITGFAYLSFWGLRRGRVSAGAVHRAAEVVHNHLRAAACEQQRVGAAEAATGAGYNRNPVVEPDFVGHLDLLSPDRSYSMPSRTGILLLLHPHCTLVR